MKTKNLLIIGDPMTDVYWEGIATRLAPEAPHPVVKLASPSPIRLPGGAAKTQSFIEKLGGGNISTLLLYNKPDTLPTKNRLIANGHQIARWDNDVEFKYVSLNKVLGMTPKNFDAIVISDYNKGTVSPNLVLRLAFELKNSSVPIYVDTKKPAIEMPDYGNRVIFFPNQKEWSEGEWPKYSNRLIQEGGEIVKKLGPKGMEYVREGAYIKWPSYARTVKDVSGAGDVVIAAFAVAEALTYPDPLKYAALAAGLWVENDYKFDISHDAVVQYSKDLGVNWR